MDEVLQSYLKYASIDFMAPWEYHSRELFNFVTGFLVMKKKILLGTFIVLIVIQFIRPTRNVQEFWTVDDISLVYLTEDRVHGMLKESCYDCHSNNTRYPWYANVQPFGWWIQSDINEAKRELNFSEFGTYSREKAKHKFEDIAEEVHDHEMPLESYLWLHPQAKLTPLQADQIIIWAERNK